MCGLSDKSRWDVKVWKKLDGKMVLTEARLILPKPSTEERLGGMGTVIDVVDGGYPFFTVTIRFGAGKPVEMLAQAEGLGVGGELANFKGKRVTAAYVVKDEPDLMEMQLSGRSLMGEAAPKKADPSWRKITGVLSGAAEVTGGDLPDDITVTPGNGPKMTFEYYVDEAMTKGEGKTVTAWYGLRRMTRLTQIKLR